MTTSIPLRMGKSHLFIMTQRAGKDMPFSRRRRKKSTATVSRCGGRIGRTGSFSFTHILPKGYRILQALCHFAGHAVGGSVDRNSSLFNGQANTDAILATLGEAGLAASAADKFYIGDKNGTFGQGNWYLPSIGELMTMYGTDTSQMTSGYGTSGVTGSGKTVINDA